MWLQGVEIFPDGREEAAVDSVHHLQRPSRARERSRGLLRAPLPGSSSSPSLHREGTPEPDNDQKQDGQAPLRSLSARRWKRGGRQRGSSTAGEAKPIRGSLGHTQPEALPAKSAGASSGPLCKQSKLPQSERTDGPAPSAALTRAAVTDPDSQETDRRTLCREGQRARSVMPGRATPPSGARQSSVWPAALRAQGQKHRAAEPQSSAGRTQATGASLTLPSPKHPPRARAA